MLFQYTTLSPTALRLVRILPYSTPASIYLSLDHQDLRPPTRYSVLVHTSLAPDVEQKKPLTLCGRAFMVPAPVFDALSAIVADGERRERRFWIREVCVNRGDEGEVEEQEKRAMMIFDGAEEVLVWGAQGGKEGRNLDLKRDSGMLEETGISVDVLKTARRLRVLTSTGEEKHAVAGAGRESKV